ncbi:MAG: hypothetical protein DHS20C19_19200 [Acidimicrobiales bacterium]|nr:MAG: hypothetical protein DHS20C19_19200 [Acidimicrobiales bacterium]
MEPMETLSQAITRLRGTGYHIDYRANDRELLECDECGAVFDPTEMQVDETVRFEGASDPGDEAILFALDAGGGHRGLYAAAYGAAVSADDIAVIRALPD